MKKKIRIIKESTQPPMGKTPVRTPTEKMGPYTKTSTYDVPQDIRDQIQQMLDASKQDPTQKIPITARVINWFKSLFAPEVKSYSDEEVDAMVAAHNKKALAKKQRPPMPSKPMPKPAKLPDGEQLSMFDEEPFEVDPKDDESLQKFLKDKEKIDPDMYRFQEAMKRHFKKD